MLILKEILGIPTTTVCTSATLKAFAVSLLSSDAERYVRSDSKKHADISVSIIRQARDRTQHGLTGISQSQNFLLKVKKKKIHPVTWHESSTLSVTSMLDGWATPHPFRCSSEEGQGATLQQAGWEPGCVWTGAENGKPTEVRTQNRPAWSDSGHRLRYPSQYLVLEKLGTCQTNLTAIKIKEEIIKKTQRSCPLFFTTFLMQHFKFKYFEGSLKTHK